VWSCGYYELLLGAAQALKPLRRDVPGLGLGDKTRQHLPADARKETDGVKAL
jgi:hypothetical protein